MNPPDTDEGSVIGQADALMRRYRSFVARSADSTPAEPARDEIDIPTLTEVVDADELVPYDVDSILDALHKDFEAALSDWLVEALPAAVTNASQHILAELDAKARNALLPKLQALLEARRSSSGSDD